MKKSRDTSSIRRHIAGSIAGCVALAWMAAAAPASAQPAPGVAATAGNVKAQALFDDAMILMKEKKYAEACPKLKESQALDPQMLTEYHLAECHASAGRTATAFALFLRVAEEAMAAGEADKETWARKRAKDLEPDLPMLEIVVSPAVAALHGLRVEVDGEARDPSNWNTPAPVDPGRRAIRVSAPGKKAWEQSIQAVSGHASKVVLPVPVEARATKGAPSTTGSSTSRTLSAPPTSSTGGAHPPRGSGLDGYRIGAIVAGVTGLAGIGAGAALGAAAFPKWNEALSHCENEGAGGCDAQGRAQKGEMHTLADFSTAAFVVGGVGLAAGALLVILPPAIRAAAKNRSAVTVTPVVGPHGMMTVLQSRF